MAKKKISIGGWAYTIGPYQKNPVPFETVVVKLKELGFDGVELGGFPPHPNPDDCPDGPSRDRVKKLDADAGLEFSGLAANLWMHKIISADDNRPFLNEFEKNLRFARDLGITTIRVDTLEPADVFKTVDYATGRDRVVRRAFANARRRRRTALRSAGSSSRALRSTSLEILDIINGVGMKNLRALYDTCHANMVAKMGAAFSAKETLPGGAWNCCRNSRARLRICTSSIPTTPAQRRVGQR